ncbi:MAG: 2-oxoglutarate dehydrogenase complex dihydrolipoyllysine-residue succinyltransferase, partial [Caulobacteraceae bacterium]
PTEITAPEGATVAPGEKLGVIAPVSAGRASPSKSATKAGAGAPTQTPAAPSPETRSKPRPETPEEASSAEARASPAAAPSKATTPAAAFPASPSVRRIAAENALDLSELGGSGRAGRTTKADALAAVAALSERSRPAQAPPSAPREITDREERVRMTRLRQTIARRLKEAQNAAAMLTTFNEADMSAVMELRSRYKEAFEARHGVRLGFMGFFVKAVVAALKAVPEVNAEIEGEDLIYKNHYDIAVAVGTERGLVTPVVRDADGLDLAGIEKAIAELSRKARAGALALEDLQGGTFTISNGGVYGSLMSTPILNAPQSGILGMHKIEERPIALEGQVVIRPMMYLALSYDHRVVDGQGAVSFLVKVKEAIDDPRRLVLGL